MGQKAVGVGYSRLMVKFRVLSNLNHFDYIVLTFFCLLYFCLGLLSRIVTLQVLMHQLLLSMVLNYSVVFG